MPDALDTYYAKSCASIIGLGLVSTKIVNVLNMVSSMLPVCRVVGREEESTKSFAMKKD